MFKKLLSIALAISLLHMIGVRPANADSKEEKQAHFAKKIKEGVSKFGTGEAARVKVKLRDKTKLEGYISKADKDSFVVMNPKTGASTTIAYANVAQIKGNNLSSGAKLAISVAIVVGLIVLLGYAVSKGG